MKKVQLAARWAMSMGRAAGMLGLLCLLIATACSQRSSSAASARAPANEAWLTAQQVKEAKLVIAPVAEQDVGGAIVTSGKVTFDDQSVSHAFSPVTGRVVRIGAQLGQNVKKGATLAIIESPDVGNAFSELGKAQAEFVAAEHEYQREKELYEAHAGAQKEFEAAEDDYRKAKAELERTRSKARLFRAGSADRVSQEYLLRSPIDGEVIVRNVSPGMEVQGLYSGGSALELFTIGHIDPVWIMADVFEMDLARVRSGARVTAKVVAYPTKVFEGKVDWVSDSLDSTSRTAKVRCTVPNPQHELKPEMYATVSISVAAERALAIPRSAMLRLGEQTMVFVELGDGPSGVVRFERRPVSVNEEEGGDYVPVTHGLKAGERVVTSGGILLSGMM